ncbi:BafA family autotransporter [Bartonella alsatica]|uniref:BafA family autotransporter n=1 Tax=Bartonella alsatica TaxID=52764 RepID=UPI003CCDD0AB
MESLSGKGRTVIFTSIPYDSCHLSFHVDEFSGNLQFNFNVSIMEEDHSSNYLSIDNGAGKHKVSVADSGVEITGSFLQKNGLITEINLITDKSGEASFTLANHSGDEIEAVDSGAYMYGLYKRERSAESNGDTTIWYLGRETGRSGYSDNRFQRTSRKQKVAVSLIASFTDADINKTSFFRSQVSVLRNASSMGNRQKTSSSRLPRHLHEKQKDSVFSVPLFIERQPIGLSRPEVSHYHPSDEQQQLVISTNASLLADQMILRLNDPAQPFPESKQELSVSNFLTTPSTDAVLSMSVTPGLVFHNELQTVRSGRRILDRNKKDTALWTYAIKSKESVATDHTDFKFEQTGIVLGIGGVSELADGEFYIGGFGSYDQARVIHARGGISGINTYSIGAYATYFDHSGLYLDGVLKYNSYQNNLKAVSTNGLAIEGNYNQWVMGTSFEAGYCFKMAQNNWLQAYAQLTWLQVEGKQVKLSNEMIGDINSFTSLRSEVGLSLGYELGSDIDTSSLAYIRAGWLRENKDNNHTTINQQHKFTTDLSGNAGKIGVGLSSLLNGKLKLYAEAYYFKGHKIKQSLQGILGVRYSF